MKKFKNILIGLMLTISMMICGNAYANDAKTSIDTLMINVPSKVNIYKSDNFGISIKASNQKIYDNIKCEIKNQMLIINFDNMYMIEDQIIKSDDVKINIALPDKVKCITSNPNLKIEESI